MWSSRISCRFGIYNQVKPKIHNNSGILPCSIIIINNTNRIGLKMGGVSSISQVRMYSSGNPNFETKENLYDWLPIRDRVYKEVSEKPVSYRSYLPPREGDEELDSTEWKPEELPDASEGMFEEGKTHIKTMDVFSPPTRERKVDQTGRAYGKGGRKKATAQVWLTPNGRGDCTVNNRPLHHYFPQWPYRDNILQPLVLTQTMDQFNITAVVHGGGLSAQSQAARMAVAVALQNVDPGFRPVLKAAGYLRRDPRMKEPKKFGRVKARKKKQWSKR